MRSLALHRAALLAAAAALLALAPSAAASTRVTSDGTSLRAASIPVQAAFTIPVRGFKYGVASGEVKSRTAYIWTRANQSRKIGVLIATDRDFENVVGGAALDARESNDNTIVDRLSNLQPGTTYYYYFFWHLHRSVKGKFTTAPASSANKTVRFAFSGDTDAERKEGQSNIFYDKKLGNNGLGAQSFGVYRRMMLEKNDFNVNMGDVIYSDSEVPGRHELANSLDEKRAKYKLNLGVENLQKLRASTGGYNHWDDHEFVNDFTKAEKGGKIYTTGVRAFREYMPVGYTSKRGLYHHQRWGKNLDLFRLDERSFRSAKASANGTCDNPQTGEPDLAPTAPQSTRSVFAALVPSFSAPVSQKCKDKIKDPSRTLLGSAQFQRFVKDLKASDAKWKVVMNEVPIQQFYALPYDRWEGYEAERQKLLHALQDAKLKNVVFLTTDTHANLVNVIRYRTLEEGGPKDSPYHELVTGPVSTMTFQREIDQATGKANSGNSVDAFFFGPPPPNGVGMPCSNVNVYSYGEVRVTGKRLTVTAKDVAGNPVLDQSDKATPCVLTLDAK